jgi:rhamnogalacturonyl hydrolase YesR
MSGETNGKPSIEKSIRMVEQWVEAHDYKGYEPFDGLSSIFRPLTFGNLLLNRLLLQLVRQSPWNLRWVLGVRPLESTIGRGYMAWGYCYMFRLTGDQEYKEKIDACLEWLIENKSPAYDDYSWGKHFDFASRSGLYVAFEPILVWTALIAHAFLEAYEIFGNGKYLDVANSVCRWIMKLPRNQTDKGFCMGYHYQDLAADIHNSNMVGAAVLARTAKHTGNRDYLAAAKGAMEYSCTRQLPDGGWLYGEGRENHWIDNFHTGYNLDSLLCYIESTGDATYRPNLDKGLEFFKAHFFEDNGCPKYYHTRTYPIDIQCAAQAIDTLATFSDRDPECLDLAKKVATWTMREMQDPKGYFYYRQYPWLKAKTPMLHWGQATMFKALARLLLAMPSAVPKGRTVV